MNVKFEKREREKGHLVFIVFRFVSDREFCFEWLFPNNGTSECHDND